MPVVDQVTASVRQAETLVALKLRKAVAGTFSRPNAKATKGLAEPLARRIEHRDESTGSSRLGSPQ